MLTSRTYPLGSFLFRGFHRSVRSLDKELLSKLRKKTGFSFVNCKKALQQFNNDIQKAETWLRQEAEKEGWHKASKLQDRPMSQGLIGFTQHNNMASMVEVNCETDFVARNKAFKGLVAQALQAMMENGENQTSNKLSWEQKELNLLPLGQKALQELCVLKVSDLGENILIRKGVFVRAQQRQSISHYIHSVGSKKEQSDSKEEEGLEEVTASQLSKCAFGKYGALLLSEEASRPANASDEDTSDSSDDEDTSDSSDDEVDQATLTRQVCQHIVGMNPVSMGSLEVPEEPKKAEEAVEKTSEKSKKQDEDLDKLAEKEEDEEEKLMDQKFIMDDKVTVRDALKRGGLVAVDFVRMACGEEQAVTEKKEGVSAG